jgi:16S rRNA U1498 N3-methylase RsmE
MTGLGPRILRIETACLLLASWASLIAESPSKSTG